MGIPDRIGLAQKMRTYYCVGRMNIQKEEIDIFQTQKKVVYYA